MGNGAASQYTSTPPSANIGSSGSSLMHSPLKLKSHPGPDQHWVIRRNEPESIENSYLPSRIRFASTIKFASAERSGFADSNP